MISTIFLGPAIISPSSFHDLASRAIHAASSRSNEPSRSVRSSVADQPVPKSAAASASYPAAKDLAAVLGVNTNTVLRALRVLRDEGLLELGRGRAIIVSGTPERGAVVARLKEFLEFARSQGYRREELLTMMESLP